MADREIRGITMVQDLHRPVRCSECGSKDFDYRGIGEYFCKDCGNVMFDDYGKVRKYVEEHRGATEIDVHIATGVSRETIKQFVRDDRFDVINGKKNV